MKLPRLREYRLTKDMVTDFRGYNHNLQIGENHFYDMKNMSSSLYPLLSPRNKRLKIRTLTKPNGLYAKNGLCWVDGTDFYYNGALKFNVTNGPKQFVGMGGYILIWPDKMYFNTHDDEYGNLGAKFITSGTVNYTLSKGNGENYGEYITGATAPDDPADGVLWLDTSSVPHVLKQYSTFSSSWVTIMTTYVKISAGSIGANFKQYDGVTISGSTDAQFNTDMIIESVGADYIVVTGIIDTIFSQEGALTVERKIPDMDFLTESENRVWGCSSSNHEIYACKLGDPFNWHCYMGLSTDSYAVTVGTDGDFTGATTHLGYVLFFKEDILHKVFGNKPANYQVTNNEVRGVEKGSEKSMVIVNETLYYKSRNGICAYRGALPELISYNLGNEKYKQGIGGSVGNKYYISMLDSDDKASLFVYDEFLGVWHKEDDSRMSYFARHKGELYYINADKGMYSVNGTSIITVDGTTALEGDIEWFAESGDIGMLSPDKKYITKLQYRLEMDEGSSIEINVMYDSSGEWQRVYTYNTKIKRSFTVPIIPRRCDHMKIRISGIGGCRIYSLAKTYEQGSEV